VCVSDLSRTEKYADIHHHSACIEMSMFISHGIWLLRTRRLRREAKETGLEFDEYPEAVRWQNNGLKLWPRRKTEEPSITSHGFASSTELDSGLQRDGVSQEEASGINVEQAQNRV